MGISARNHGLDITGTHATINKIMAADPRRIARIEINITMPQNNFGIVEKKLLEAAARACPVAFSLEKGIEQVIAFEWPSSTNP
jgi:uncharacterized OsmC-like protein